MGGVVFLFVLVVLGIFVVVWFVGRGTSGAPVILRPDMLHPADAPISTAEAKRIFREWMLKIGYLDKQEVGDHVGYFSEAIKDHEEMLKIDIDSEKENTKELIAEEKDGLKEVKRDLANCKNDTEKAELESDIEAHEEQIAFLAESVATLEKRLADFKKDKREFLVDYINTQVHGEGWQNKIA